MSTNRRTYDAEFKRNAVALAAEVGKTASEVATRLGVATNLVYRWRREFARQGGLSFPGQGKQALTAEQRWVKELKTQLRDAKMERDILKKHWPSSARHRNEISIHMGRNTTAVFLPNAAFLCLYGANLLSPAR